MAKKKEVLLSEILRKAPKKLAPLMKQALDELAKSLPEAKSGALLESRVVEARDNHKMTPKITEGRLYAQCPCGKRVVAEETEEAAARMLEILDILTPGIAHRLEETEWSKREMVVRLLMANHALSKKHDNWEITQPIILDFTEDEENKI